MATNLKACWGRRIPRRSRRREAPRYLREALLINPYITAVTEIAVDFAGSRLTVSGRAETIYGEVLFDALI